jgi:hypothetical protein
MDSRHKRKRTKALLIQGPLNAASILNIRLNLGGGAEEINQVIVSAWLPKTPSEELIAREIETLAMLDPRIELILGDFEDVAFSYLGQPGAAQIASIALGLPRVTTEVVIKCRSDELYDLEPLSFAVDTEPQKIHFTSFITRDWLYHPFHISDHLFALPTDLLRRAIRNIESLEIGSLFDELGRHSSVPETFLGFMIFKQREKISVKGTWRNRRTFALWNKHFQLLDLKQFRTYSLTANGVGINGLTDVGLLSAFSSFHGFQLNYIHYSTTRQLRPRLLHSTFNRRLRPLIRAVYFRLLRPGN